MPLPMTIAIIRQMRFEFAEYKCKHCGKTATGRTVLMGNDEVGYSCGCNTPKGHKIIITEIH